MPSITELVAHDSLGDLLRDFIPRHPSLEVLLVWTWDANVNALLNSAPKLLPHLVDPHESARGPSEMRVGCIRELCLGFTSSHNLDLFEQIVRLYVLDEANGVRRELTITVLVPLHTRIKDLEWRASRLLISASQSTSRREWDDEQYDCYSFTWK